LEYRRHEPVDLTLPLITAGKDDGERVYYIAGHIVSYIASVWEHVAEADGKIVFNKLHVAQHLGDAVDKVRRKEHKTLKGRGRRPFVGDTL
jgi:hypothetical protein